MNLVKFKSSDYNLYQQVLTLRNNVLRQPLGLTIFDENLEIEKENDFYAVLIEGQVIGTLSFYSPTVGIATLTAFAIAPDYQRKGYGNSLLNFLITDLQQQGYTLINVSARATALTFYQQAGFNPTGERSVKPMIDQADYLMTLRL